MVRHLAREGVVIGRHRVRRLMRLLGLEAIYRKPRTTVANPDHRVYPYLLRGLTIERPNHAWCSDITYIPVRGGFLYLVAIMDWASRRVLGVAAEQHDGHRVLLHRAPHAGVQQRGRERDAGELAALIGVEDLSTAEPLQRVDIEGTGFEGTEGRGARERRGFSTYPQARSPPPQTPTPLPPPVIQTRPGRLTTDRFYLNLPLDLSKEPGPPHSRLAFGVADEDLLLLSGPIGCGKSVALPPSALASIDSQVR